jgi:drug/metabolite transporter (DMT)-like permease
MPIFTLIIACLFKKETLTKIKVTGVVLAFLGIMISVSRSWIGNLSGQDDLLGILLMLASAVCAAIYSTFSKALIILYGPIFFTALSMTAGMLILFPIAHTVDTFLVIPTFSSVGWISLVFLGVIGGAFQFTAYTWALKWLSPTRTAIYLTLTPISAIILAYPLLGERIKPEVIVGLIIILIAIFLLNRARLQQ